MITARGEEVISSYGSYLTDESRLQGEPAEKLFFPLNEADVCSVVHEAHRNKQPVTVSGSRTGITGGAVSEGGYLVSLEKMDRILRIEKQKKRYLVTMEAGVTLETLTGLTAGKMFDPSIPGADAFNKDPSDYLYPVDPTERTASIGGTCATNASGARTFYYGPTRNFIRGLSAVLDNGEVLCVQRGTCTFSPSGILDILSSAGTGRTVQLPSYSIPDVKHAAGYYAEPGMDITDLFIGSEGTLGIITQVTAELIPSDSPVFSAIAFFPGDEQGIDFSIRARESSAVKPLALEFFNSRSLALLQQRKEILPDGSGLRDIPEGAGSAVYFEQSYEDEDHMFEAFDAWDSILSQCGSSMEQTWGGVEQDEQKTLKDFRHAVPESVNTLISERRHGDPRIHKVGTDMSVPDSYVKEIYGFYCEETERSGLDYVIFGHVGDNHLHLNILPRTYEEVLTAEELYVSFARKAVSMGGSVAAEHGIGKLKKKFLSLMFPEKAINEMKRVKASLDPKNIFSPSNLFE